tara:strand:- start:174 stop:647 length:474 start_codon:yes stop_codon:yes gene_type:complete
MLDTLDTLVKIFLLILMLPFYVYISWAHMKIARRTNTNPSWLAWIPFANLYLLSKMAKKHWWPVIFFVGGIISLRINFFSETLFVVLGLLFLLIFFVFSLIWMWKIFVFVGRPGWWALTILIPSVGFLIFLILLGVAAWGEEKNIEPVRRKGAYLNK